MIGTLGKNIYRIEDIYSDDNGLERSNQEILISCKNKHKAVRGYLCEPLKLSAKSNWDSVFGGGMASIAGSFLDTVNNMEEMGSGMGIQQPWMNRKYWKSTEPFSFSLSMNFTAEKSAKTDVYEPCTALLSFAFPREGSTNENSYIGKLKKAAEVNKENGTSDIISSVASALSMYHIPGPSIGYQNEKSGDDGGDAVTICIGQAYAFGAVYLTDVSVEFSETMDSYGYPVSARATINATCMDVNYCDPDGSFLISQFAENQNECSDAVAAISNAVKQVGQDIKNIIMQTIGFYTGERHGA